MYRRGSLFRTTYSKKKKPPTPKWPRPGDTLALAARRRGKGRKDPIGKGRKDPIADRRGGGGGGGGAYWWGGTRPGRRAPVVPKGPSWWGEQWFGEGRAVEIPGLGQVNLRDMRHYQSIDPLYRSWLQQAVEAAGQQGWWKNAMVPPVSWMAPKWSQM